MSWASDLQSIAKTCVDISNQVGNPSGFVSIRRLLERFNVAIYIRPLLVEGMLVSLPEPNSARTRLTVLVDSETFRVTNKEIAAEDEADPLPTRFRTTVAHELLHSLAFRPDYFGLRLKNKIHDQEAAGELVKAIEADTERLTPLLLWPEKALDHLIATRKKTITPGEVANLAAKLGISRQMVITRLRLRRSGDGIVYCPWLADVALGVGEWVAEKRAVFHKWPLFVNFDRNVVPSFLHDIAAQDRLPAAGLFEDENFLLTGGEHSMTFLTVDAGTKDNRSVERMQAMVFVENGTGKAGGEFVFMARRKQADDVLALDHALEEGDA
jgi:hypothetical protein